MTINLSDGILSHKQGAGLSPRAPRTLAVRKEAHARMRSRHDARHPAKSETRGSEE